MDLIASLSNISRNSLLAKILRRKTGKVGVALILAIFFIIFIGPLTTPYDPYETDLNNRLMPPSFQHLFGTDKLGRDIFSRVVYGGRITILIAVTSVVIALLIGVFIGILSGYLGGRLDNILMRITDMFMAFPSLILALAIAAMLRPGLFNVIAAIASVSWTSYARLSRALTLQIKEEPFIEAVRSFGASDLRILFRHIFPLVLPQALTLAMLNLGGAVLTAAGLGFLGLGVPPPTPEWGLMVSEGRDIIQDYWWVSTFPGIMIFITVLGFNLLGDAIRDAMDVRL
mgnify:CR=1 FL=1